jgi:hypothetical protein
MAKDVKVNISVNTSGIGQATRGASEFSREMAKGAQFLRAAGLGLNALGMNTTGYTMRMMGMAGIGTSTVGSMSSATLGGVGVALGGIAIASKLVEVGLEALSSVVKSTAGAFLGAITSLGGARSLQENIEGGAKRQDMISSAQYTVGSSERSSQKDILNWSVKNAADPNMGGFSSEDWTKALNATGTRSGIQKSFMADKSANDFIAHFALMSKDAEGKPDLARAANLHAMFKAQNKGKSESEIQDIILSAAGIAQHGSFTAEELSKHPELLALTAGLGANRSDSYKQVFGLTSVFAPEVGVGGAHTAIRGLRRGIQMTAKQGLHYSQDAVRSGQIQNLDVAAAEYSAIPSSQYATLPGRGNIESQQARDVLRQHAGVDINDSFKVAKEKILNYIQTEERGALTQRDLTDSLKDTITITSQLKTAFNNINDTLSGAFFKSIGIVATALNDWTKDFPKYQKEIEEYVDKTMSAFLELIPVITSFGVMLAEITGFFGKTIGVAASISEKKALGELSVTAVLQEGQVERDKKYLQEHFSVENKEKLDKDQKELTDTVNKIKRANDNIEALDKLPGNIDKFIDSLNKVKDWADKRAAELKEKTDHPAPPDPSVGSPLGNH